MRVKRKKYDLFVDDKHIKQVLSGWPIGRVMAQLAKNYPDAMRLEVKLYDDPDMSSFLLRGCGRFKGTVLI